MEIHGCEVFGLAGLSWSEVPSEKNPENFKDVCDSVEMMMMMMMIMMVVMILVVINHDPDHHDKGQLVLTPHVDESKI